MVNTVMGSLDAAAVYGSPAWTGQRRTVQRPHGTRHSKPSKNGGGSQALVGPLQGSETGTPASGYSTPSAAPSPSESATEGFVPINRSKPSMSSSLSVSVLAKA